MNLEFFLSLTKAQCRAVAIVGIILGMTLGLIGMVVGLNTAHRRVNAETARQKISQECGQNAQTLGFVVKEIDKNNLQFSKEGIANAPALLNEASMAMLVCPGWRLQKFCLGQTCDVQGVVFELNRPPAAP